MIDHPLMVSCLCAEIVYSHFPGYAYNLTRITLTQGIKEMKSKERDVFVYSQRCGEPSALIHCINKSMFESRLKEPCVYHSLLIETLESIQRLIIKDGVKRAGILPGGRVSYFKSTRHVAFNTTDMTAWRITAEFLLSS